MRNKITFLILILVASLPALAESRPDFKITAEPTKNLLEESEKLKLEAEPSVQAEGESSRLQYGIFAGVIQAQDLSHISSSRFQDYGAVRTAPLLALQTFHFPFSSKTGRWGWGGGISYSYFEQRENIPYTSLHLLPVELSLLYRFQKADNQKITAFILGGLGSMIYFQRGSDQYSTSGARLIGSATAGLSFNLNQIFGWRTRVQNEFVAEYKMLSPVSSQGGSWKAEALQIGSSFSL